MQEGCNPFSANGDGDADDDLVRVEPDTENNHQERCDHSYKTTHQNQIGTGTVLKSRGSSSRRRYASPAPGAVQFFDEGTCNTLCFDEGNVCSS